MGDYENKGSSDAGESPASGSGEKASSDSDATAHEEHQHSDSDSDSDDEDGKDKNKKKQKKGPSVCSVDQSAITGESLAVDKYVGDTAYYTCGVKRGKCYGVVTVSAKESFVGKTASLVSSQFNLVLGMRIGLIL